MQLAFICAVYPCLILTYMGQAAFLTKNKREIEFTFYKAIPSKHNSLRRTAVKIPASFLSTEKEMMIFVCRTGLLASVYSGYTCIHCW